MQDLLRESRYTRARRAANQALKLLPALQHHFIWDIVLQAVTDSDGFPVQSCVLLLRRYAKLKPGGVERLFRYLLKAGKWDEAVVELCAALRDMKWEPEGGKTREELWMELARVAARHPKDVVSVDVPALLRGAIRRADTDVGELWVVLGEYFIRKGLFEDARNVYEGAVATVNVVREFAVVFDAYAKFEEGLVMAAMEDVEVVTAEVGEGRELQEAKEMVELLIARLEFLTERRPMLLSDVWLRQNPHNVHEWHKRARLFKQAKDAVNVVDTYTKAVQTVDPWRATNGRPHTLWLAFARYYEDAKDLTSARRVLDKAVSSPENFRSVEDLAAVWCEYAEMELRCTMPDRAREVLLKATEKPKKVQQEEGKQHNAEASNVEAVMGARSGNFIVKHVYDNSSPAWNAYKSMRVWHFLIDITQSIGTTSDVIQLHHQMFELRIASPQTIISVAAFLESHRLFEQAFRLYDRGVSALSWPAALEVWVVYLTKFVKRYGSRKLERARDLYEEAIRTAPVIRKGGHDLPHEHIRLLYIMYANMEEEYSLARHALKVLSRATKAVREEDRADMFRMYIVKTTSFYGVTKTRPIYEDALSSLAKPEDVLEFAMRYATMETRLGEIDRARGIYVHTCQIADPRRKGFFEIFWKSWNDFELEEGTEDSFRDMLREKRSVQLNHRGVILDDDFLDSATNGERKGIRFMIKDPETLNGGIDIAPNTENSTENLDDGHQGTLEEGTEQAGANDADVGTDGAFRDRVGTELSTVPNNSVINDANNDQKEASDLDENAGETKYISADEQNGEPEIVHKKLPDASRKLVSAARSHAQKRGRDEGEILADSGGDNDNGASKPLGALERIKRSRANAT